MDEAPGFEPARSTLHTAWSMLGQLEQQEPDAWQWFLRRYEGFVRAGLRRVLPASASLDQACQEFWSECFEKDLVGRADRNRRFRAFLAGAVRTFGRAWWRKDRAVAGRGAADAAGTAGTAGTEDGEVDPQATDALPEDVEMRLFGAEVLRLALAAVRAANAQDAELLADFYGLDDRAPRGVAEIAARSGQKPNAIHQRLHRARKRLRAEVEQEIARTVDREEHLQEEVACLLEAIQAERPGALG